MDFSLTDPPANKRWIVCEGLTFGYGDRTIFREARFNLSKGSKTAIIGENGAGKTTLLNLIYQRNQAIRLAPRVRLGYFYQDFDHFDPHKTALENVLTDSVQNETTARTILAGLRITGDAVHKPISVLSGGEKLKVALAKLLTSDANLLLLDEPTNYLDTDSLEALQNLLQAYQGAILLVSHDQAFVNAVANQLFIIEDQQITAFDGNLALYQKRRTGPSPSAGSDAQKTLLQLRLTEIVTKMDLPGADREALEVEYQATLAALKEL